jgi:hypothetical protein
MVVAFANKAAATPDHWHAVMTARERVLGAEHPETLVSVHDLALLYASQGRYGGGRAVVSAGAGGKGTGVLGAEHPDTLASVHSLAELYTRHGRYGEAEPLYQRAREEVAA